MEYTVISRITFLNNSCNYLFKVSKFDTFWWTKIKHSSQVLCLGVILKDYLHWDIHLINLEKKVSHRIGSLSKIRHYVSKHLLQIIHYSVFNFHWSMHVKYGHNTKTAFNHLNHQLNHQFHQENRVLKITDFIRV